MKPDQRETTAPTALEWQHDMQLELAVILHVSISDLPAVFRMTPIKILKMQIDQDLIAAYPDVYVPALRDWFHRYTRSEFYLRRAAYHAKHRHDLNGQDVCELDQTAKTIAKQRYQRLKRKNGPGSKTATAARSEQAAA